MKQLAVGLGGALGAMSRFAIGLWMPPVAGFPFATLVVNLVGSFVLAYLLTNTNMFKNINIKLAVTTGFLGAFTTFSTFSFETFDLLASGKVGHAVLYVSLSFIGGILLSYTGYHLAKGGRSV